MVTETVALPFCAARAGVGVTEWNECEHCGKRLPAFVSRCRRRTCPAYALVWARDTQRKLRENRRAYGGKAAMLTLTAPGVDVGLAWDPTVCTHGPKTTCSGPKGCRVAARPAGIWNEASRRYWRELNRVCKQRADRTLRGLGARDFKGHVLAYQWEMQTRGVWHLHFVVGVETPMEMAWASEYVRSMRNLAPFYLFGHVDAKPLRRPRPAEHCAGYIAKYLTKRKEDGTVGAAETVTTAGRSLLTYVSRNLTSRTGVTMRALRNARLLWAYRQGHLPPLRRTLDEVLLASQLLDGAFVAVRAP